MKKLSQNLNSDFIAAANRLGGRNARRKIVAYVESYEDVFSGATCCARSKRRNIISRCCCLRAIPFAKVRKQLWPIIWATVWGHQ